METNQNPEVNMLPEFSAEEHLSIAMEHAKMLYWEYDIPTGHASGSPMINQWFGLATAITGYPESYLKLGFVAEENIEEYIENVRKIQQGAEYVEFDVRMRTLHHDYDWMRIRMTGIKDDQGRPSLAICTAERIAEFKELERRFTTTLRQNEISSWRYDMVRRTIVLNPHSFYAFDRDENFEIHDIPESQIRLGLCHPDDVEILRRLYRRMHQGERLVQENLRFMDSRLHEYRWKKCIYSVIADDDGRPTYAVGSAMDITERLEAERQYRAAVEYRRRTMIEDMILSGHCNVTKDHILDMTDLTGLNFIARTNGTRTSFFQMLREMILDPEKQETFDRLFTNESMIRNFAQGNQNAALTCEITLDGRRRWVTIHVTCLQAPETGDLEGFLTIVDVTAAYIQEQLLNTVVECDYDYVAHINFEADSIVMYQKSAEGKRRKDYISGEYYSYGRFVRRAYETVVVEEDKAFFLAHMRPEFVRAQLEKDQTYEFICHIREESGAIRAKRARFAVYDGDSNTVTFSRTDVTEMIHEEEAKQKRLQESLDAALRSSLIINTVANQDYDYVMVVDIATNRYQLYSASRDQSMAGIPATGDYSRTIADYAEQYVVLADRKIAVDGMSTAYIQQQLTDKPVYITQARVVSDDGAVRYKQAKFSYLDQEHTQILITRVDITDLIVEEEIKREELTRALGLAEQATRAKTDFLSRMSHDLRTPMNAIIGLSALTLDDAEKPAVVRENMTKMRAASDFMLGLVNDMLDMAKIESGAVRLNLEPYSYGEFVVNMRTMFQAQCEEKNIEFSIPDPIYNPVVEADKIRVNQIFFNILSNAVKYTPQGGKITYRLENIRIEGDSASAQCVITDTGIGMSEEFQKHLFEPFMQESHRVTPELQGSGLGLSITKQLVELMGGEISIHSVQNQGTTVRVRLGFRLLERSGDRNIHKHIDPSAVAGMLAGKRALLVEDHPLNTQIARAQLERQNISVTHAENGRRGLEIFRASPEGHYDVVLMDIRMPVMNGLDAARAIRSLPRGDAGRVPIIAMTANAYAEDIQKSLDAGMNAHLAKPIDPQRLYETIAGFLA